MSEISFQGDYEIPHTLDNLDAIQDYILGQDYLADPVLRRDFYEQMNGDDFVEYTQQLSSLVIDGDVTRCRPFSKGVSKTGILDGVDPREREGLVREAWKVAQVILKDRSLADEEALMRAGIVMRAGVIGAHVFDDGNGRTTRVMHMLMAYGGGDRETLATLLSDDGTRRMQFSPLVGQNLILHKAKISSIRTGVRRPGIDGSMELVEMSNSIISEFIARHPGDAQEFIARNTFYDKNNEPIIDTDSFMNDLQMADRAQVYIRDIEAIKRDQKYLFVHDALNGFLSDRRSMPKWLSDAINPNYNPSDLKKRFRIALAREAIAGFEGKGLTQIELHTLRHKMYSEPYYDQHVNATGR